MKEVTIYGKFSIFENDFKIYGTPDNPYFLAKEVAEWIDYAYKDKEKGRRNINMMLNSVDEDEKIKMKLLQEEDNQRRGMWFVTEMGLYELLMLSRKPIAKQFKKEVKKILKQIRLTGGAITLGREEDFVKRCFPSFNKETQNIMVKDMRKQNSMYKQSTTNKNSN